MTNINPEVLIQVAYNDLGSLKERARDLLESAGREIERAQKSLEDGFRPSIDGRRMEEAARVLTEMDTIKVMIHRLERAVERAELSEE